MDIAAPYEADRGAHPLVRLSPHYCNTEAELDRAAGVIAAVARTARAGG